MSTPRAAPSRPIIDELEPWLRARLDLISQKTKLAEAIRYAFAVARVIISEASAARLKAIEVRLDTLGG